MFKKKSEQPAGSVNAASTVDQDLIVHNMPNRSRLGSSSAPVGPSSGMSGSVGQKNNVKSVGAIIIGLGVILVGALIYLSFRFVIKPQAESNDINQASTSAPIVTNQAEEEKANGETATTSSTTPIVVVERDY